MKKNIFKYIKIAPAFLALACFASCSKMLDVKPQDQLEFSQMYRNVTDANAAVLGIYGKFMKNIPEQYILMNELQGDLMDVTTNSDVYLKQINEHSVTVDNSYINPRPFYEVILDCNDAMKNFIIMRDQKKFTQDEFNQRYSDIAALRCWLYLQLGINYGNIPYVTSALDNVDSIKNQNNFPVLTFNQMIDTLVNCMESLPYKENYTDADLLTTTMDGYNTKSFFIPKRMLLGDLYLWQGNYLQAVTNYKTLLDYYSTDLYIYKIEGAVTASSSGSAIGLGVGYYNDQRRHNHDYRQLINSNTDGWRSIFGRTMDNTFYQEWIWALPFNSNFSPADPLINLFSNQGTGKYLVKPSQAAMDNWNDTANYQSNGFPFDARGQLTWNTINGQPVIMKHIYNYDPLTPYAKNGKFFLTRAALLNLRYAEAANRDNHWKVGYALLNYGINSTYHPGIFYYGGVDTLLDITSYEQTGLSFPYNFDGRQDVGTISFINPISNVKITRTQIPVGIRGNWCKGSGVRGRAGVISVALDTTTANTEDFTEKLEGKIIDEAALELAYEGNRWPDLMRIARRRNDPAYLADKIYNKLLKAGNSNAAAVRAKLMDPKNWYLPFKLK